MTGQIADREQCPAVRQFQRVVPVAADQITGMRREVAGRDIQCAGPGLREQQRAAPCGEYGLLELDRHTALGLCHVLLAS